MSKLKELREARAKIHADLATVLALPASTENNERARKLLDESNKLKTDIDKIETRGLSGIGDVLNSDTEVEYRRAFQTYLRMGEANMPHDMKESLKQRKLEKRANGEGAPTNGHIGTYSDLGYFVPTGFVNAVEIATKWYANLMDAFGSITTGSGNPLPYPTSNDTTQKASQIGENAGPVSEQDLTANQVVFGAWKYTSGIIRASLELVEDSAFDIESFVAKQMGIRFGREWEDVLTNGDGDNKPTGILIAIADAGITPVIAQGSVSNDGITGNTGVNSVGYWDLVNLEHSVDKSYRKGASYMMHDTTVASLQKVLDKFGRPLFVPGINGEPDKVNGYPIVVNNSMPQIAASATSIVFGDLSKFLVRRVMDFRVQVLRERYADYGQTGYVGFARIDSNLLDAGTHPINVLQHHS
jgi:HK97 family phage major capsid protein